jgi:hypothetical protein
MCRLAMERCEHPLRNALHGRLPASKHDQVSKIYRTSFGKVDAYARVAIPLALREILSRDGKLHTRLMPLIRG